MTLTITMTMTVTMIMTFNTEKCLQILCKKNVKPKLV